MVIKSLLEGSLNGVGEHHLTPIFPCGIFQMMNGVNRHEGDPNYDLYKLALKSTTKRIYPNYVNVDWSINEGYDRNNPRTYTSTMGCHAYGTKIIMSDGSYKEVQDIKEGDSVMGWDGTPRIVESLIKGYGKMYRIDQSRGESYVVNEDHILALEYSISQTYRGLHKGDRINMSVRDFLKIPEDMRRHFKGYKGSYELTEKEFKIPPYILGLWLGDGTASNTSFSVNMNEKQIIKDLTNYAESIGKQVHIDQIRDEKCYNVRISDMATTNQGNIFRQGLVDYNLLDNKHIPECYFYGSKAQRSALLSGLINTDGWGRVGRGRKTVCFGNTNYNLIIGAKRLADSLGYATNIIKARGESIGVGICEGAKLKPYYHLSIHAFDDKHLMESKKTSINLESRRNFNTSTLKINQVEDSDFYGFELTGDRLYQIEDGTVTHNCRTYNGYDINGLGQMKDGRGNLAPVTIILPTLAMETKLALNEGESLHDKFMKYLDKKIHEAKDMLLERFERMCTQSPKAASFMWTNKTMFGYNEEEGIKSALKHGTLAIGQLGLAECLQILIGTDHTTREGMELAIEIETLFNKRCKEFKKKYSLNYGVYYTPAENLCYTAFKKFKAKYGDIANVTYIEKANGKHEDKEYFTNSMHVPVWHEMSPFEKIDIEKQLTKFSNAGCITYVELPSTMKHNTEALETIVNYAMDNDIPYFAVNVPLDECHDCGYTDEMGESCPECGSKNIWRLRRVTGYLSTTYEHFNLGKQDEVKDRVKHIKH